MNVYASNNLLDLPKSLLCDRHCPNQAFGAMLPSESVDGMLRSLKFRKKSARNILQNSSIPDMISSVQRFPCWILARKEGFRATWKD